MPLVLALLVLSQVPPPSIEVPTPGISLQLTQYLQLTEEQSGKVGELNRQSTIYQSSRYQKQAQLQVEIIQETAKESPDPFVIGSRYVEIESIKRELALELKKVTGRIQELLTLDQQVKLTQLQESLKIYPIACEAVTAGFIVTNNGEFVGNPFYGEVIVPGGIGMGSGNLFLSNRRGVPSCSMQWVNTSEFRGTPERP